jgi:hypothetical protein
VIATSLRNRESNLKFISILTIFGVLLLFSSFSNLSPRFRAYALIPGMYSPSENQPVLNVNLTYGQILRIEAPSTSNVTIISLSGGQYDIGLYSSDGKNDLLFTPAQIANYTLVVDVSSNTSNYANISEIGTPSTAWTNNITGTGDLILNLDVIVVEQPVSPASNWNPLFGFTGISLGGVTLDTTDFLAIFAIFSIALMMIGIKRSQKLLYTGLFFLSIIGMIVVGILVVAAIIGSYLAGFVVIKSYFGFRSRRQNGL